MLPSRLSRHFAHIPFQIVSLITVTLLAHVTLSGGRVAASLYALKHGGSEAWAGIAFSAFGLMPVLLSLQMGRWIDRVGTRRVMRICQLLMISGLVLSATVQSLPTILITGLLAGTGFAGYMLAANVCVSYMIFKHEGDRVGMLAWLQMGNSVSSVIGPTFVGLLIDHSGYRMAFGALAAVVVCSLLVGLRANLPDGTRDSKPKSDEPSIVRAVFADPRLLRIYLLAMTVSLSWDAFTFMVPVLGQTRGYSATTIGLVLSSFAIGTFAIRALLPWLSRKMAEWRMLTVSFGLAACVFFTLPLADNAWLHAALGFVFGLAAGVGQPNILGLIYRAMPPGRAGEGAGLRAMMGNMMGLTGPSLFGAITALFGAVPVFIMVGGIMSGSCWQARRGEQTAQAPGTAA
ncbi:MAG: MFS transporter [Rhodocyclaceae bacterium]